MRNYRIDAFIKRSKYGKKIEENNSIPLENKTQANSLSPSSGWLEFSKASKNVTEPIVMSNSSTKPFNQDLFNMALRKLIDFWVQRVDIDRNELSEQIIQVIKDNRSIQSKPDAIIRYMTFLYEQSEEECENCHLVNPSFFSACVRCDSNLP